ncbi:MAG: DUF4417 domain-containing protein [Lachnospiraceae bacterium]|nr:DUF4417 domain-containing protein [Lachnospiraceae bacterium]
MIYRQAKQYENLQKRIFDGAGNFGIPQIYPATYEGNCEFIPFNYAKSCKDRENKGVHFFIDDYQFNRLWTNIDCYVDMLSQFQYVMTPDFSTYTDFPRAIQIYNHYRKHWVGAYLQEAGIKVIPTISWSTPDSFDWCFDGEATHGCVAVSSVGAANSKEKKTLFLAGYNAMLERLRPETILFYGKVPEECEGNIVHIPPFSDRFAERKRVSVMG